MKKLFKFLFIIIVVIFLIMIFISAPFIWNNWVTYPNLEAERTELLTKYKKTKKYIKQNEYKGVFHMHSYWSHDSRGVLKEILPAAEKAGFNFLFFSDHPHSNQDSFPRSYAGNYNDIIFEPGTENSNGFMVTPMDSVVMDWSIGDNAVISEVVKNNGLVLYVHTEKQHEWDNTDYQGMEIYNIHTDFLDGNDGLYSIVLNLIFNGSKYHHWVFREIFDEQTEILNNWDMLNKNRRIVGMAGVDAHNNQSFRARYREDGKVEWIGPNAKTIEIVEAGLKESLLLGEPDHNGWAFNWEVDPYFISFNHVANHVFSDSLTNFGIKNNLVKGHAFISFQSLAHANGFQYFTLNENDDLNAIMGDSIKIHKVAKLKVVSPFPVKYQLLKDGVIIDEIENVYNYEYKPDNVIGNYRIVARLYLDEKWIPWVYTNPIYLY